MGEKTLTVVRRILLPAAAVLATAAAAADVDVLCIYYPEWHRYPYGDVIFGKGRTEWDFVDTAPARFKGHEQPIRLVDGHPDDSDPKDVAKEIGYAADAGIDVFLYDWYWADHAPIEQEALERGFLKAPNRDRMKFAIMWAYHHRSDAFRAKKTDSYRGGDETAYRGRWFWKLAFTPEEWREAIGYCIRTYFREPTYYRKDGKLFFSMYNAKWFIDNNGGVEGVRGLFAWAQEEVRKAGLPPIHFSGMVRKAEEVGDVTKAGFESTSLYCVTPYDCENGQERMEKKGEMIFGYGEFVEAQKRLNESIAAVSPAHIPLAVRGWDSSARCRLDEPFPWRKASYPYLGIVHGATPELFRRAVENALDLARRAKGKPGTILVNAWNEYTEGSYLMPDKRNGDAFLSALKGALARP